MSEAAQKKNGHLRMFFRMMAFFLVDAVDDPIPQKTSLPKKKRIVREALCSLEGKLRNSALGDETKIILICASVFEIAEPLKNAGFNVINTEMIDFPHLAMRTSFARSFAHCQKLMMALPITASTQTHDNTNQVRHRRLARHHRRRLHLRQRAPRGQRDGALRSPA